MNVNNSWRFALVAAVAVAASAAVGGEAVAAAERDPQIGAAVAIRAPIGAKGGVESPYVYCANSPASPKVRWVLTNTNTGRSLTYRWHGVNPTMRVPRVPVGTYKSKTTAWCRTVKGTRRQSLTVREKTHATTISRDEFRSIRPGMSATQVSKIVGYGGRSAGSYAGKKMRTYDMMAFWSWALITHRDGGVVVKSWGVAHDPRRLPRQGSRTGLQ